MQRSPSLSLENYKITIMQLIQLYEGQTNLVQCWELVFLCMDQGSYTRFAFMVHCSVTLLFWLAHGSSLQNAGHLWFVKSLPNCHISLTLSVKHPDTLIMKTPSKAFCLMLDPTIRDHGGVQSISVIADTVGHTIFEHTPQDHKP